jgi:hypothetical protein
VLFFPSETSNIAETGCFLVRVVTVRIKRRQLRDTGDPIFRGCRLPRPLAGSFGKAEEKREEKFREGREIARVSGERRRAPADTDKSESKKHSGREGSIPSRCRPSTKARVGSRGGRRFIASESHHRRVHRVFSPSLSPSRSGYTTRSWRS